MKRSWLIGAALLLIAVVAGAIVLFRSANPDGPLVVIDAGHGGSFTNTGVGGVKEEEVNLAIAKRLRKKLMARNYRVIMTRTSDNDVADKTLPSWRYVGAPGRPWVFGVDKTATPRTTALHSDLQARVDIANRAGADAFVSVHNNASADASNRGTESYAFRGDAPGKALAASVQDAVIARTGNDNHGSHASGLYVVRWTNMPAVLVEGAYFTNPQDAEALRSARFQNRLADGIADGIDRWFTSYPLREVEPQLAGADSAALACAVSSAGFPKGAKAVVVLPAETTALGPSAATLAAKLGTPLLLASASAISAQTADELARLKPERVVVVGVSSGRDLESITAAITRAAGKQARVELLADKTAPLAATVSAATIGVPKSGNVAIVDAADSGALTALAPYAARGRVPVLLSEEGRLGTEALAYLAQNRGRIKSIVAVGCAKHPTVPDGWPVTTVQSADPDQLAASLLVRTDPATGKAKLAPVVVDSAHAPDVFTAAAEASRREQPLVQMRDGVLGPYSREFMTNRIPRIGGFLVLRDAGSITPVAESALRKAVGR